MEMTNNEIVRSYNSARNKKKQLKILAELNSCDVEKIESIVGIEVKEKPSRADWLASQLDSIDRDIHSLEEKYTVYARELSLIDEGV